MDSLKNSFHRLFEAAPDALVIVDGSGRIVLINAQTERLFGYTRDELTGQSVEVLVPTRLCADHRGHRIAYQRSARTGLWGAGLDLFALRKDGSEFPVEISLSPLEVKEGSTG